MMKHTLLILFAAALLVAGCNNSDNNPDKNNRGDVPSGKEDKTDDGSITVTDIDGNTYKTVQIGGQVWMAENLKVTKDREGKEIALGSEESFDTPYRYCPNNDQKNVEKYGYLYNWEAAMRVCPKGWHLPTDGEWLQLEMAAGMSEEEAYDCPHGCGWRGDIAAKLCGDEGWKHSSEANAAGNTSASGRNITGFGALPAGLYKGNFGENAYFWNATEFDEDAAGIRYLRYDCAGVYRGDHTGKYVGCSVRCVRD